MTQWIAKVLCQEYRYVDFVEIGWHNPEYRFEEGLRLLKNDAYLNDMIGVRRRYDNEIHFYFQHPINEAELYFELAFSGARTETQVFEPVDVTAEVDGEPVHDGSEVEVAEHVHVAIEAHNPEVVNVGPETETETKHVEHVHAATEGHDLELVNAEPETEIEHVEHVHDGTEA